MSYPTAFIESNFVLAVLRGNTAEAERLAHMMLGFEQLTLSEVLEEGREILDRIDSA